MRRLVSLLIWFGSTCHAGELWLGVGEVATLPAPPGAAVRVGSRGLLRVIDGERAVRVIALKPGAGTLVIGGRALAVRVVPAHQRAFTAELRATLRTLKGLRLELDAGRPEITGTLLRFSDWQTLAELARRRRGEYGFRAHVLPDVGDVAIAHFTRVARDRGYPLVRFRAAPEFTAVLPGAARGLKSAVESSFSAYGVRVEAADTELQIQPLVTVHVVLAEVSRGFSRSFGVKWPEEYAAQLIPRVTTDGGLLAALRALESQGRAQVLAAPDLTCRSGGRARFHAGGELPIRTASRTRQSVEWKSFGVMLNVHPRADYQGNISVDLQTEISLVDFANAVDGVPAIKKNVVESQFDLPGRRTIALSGLIRRDLGSNQDGVPFLGALPLLGRLFSSRQFQKNQSELVVFVTPEVNVPAPDARVRLPAGWVDDD